MERKAEIDMAAKFYPDTRRVFLADGDAINLSNDRMIQILKYLYSKFPAIKRVSCYAMPMNLLKKKDGELKELKAAGLDMLNIGI